MPLLGRWIIANVGLGVQVRSMTGSQAEAPEGITPVVPCDDEAIERATRLIYPLIQNARWTEDGARAMVEGIFRAAGETP